MTLNLELIMNHKSIDKIDNYVDMNLNITTILDLMSDEFISLDEKDYQQVKQYIQYVIWLKDKNKNRTDAFEKFVKRVKVLMNDKPSKIKPKKFEHELSFEESQALIKKRREEQRIIDKFSYSSGLHEEEDFLTQKTVEESPETTALYNELEKVLTDAGSVEAGSVETDLPHTYYDDFVKFDEEVENYFTVGFDARKSIQDAAVREYEDNIYQTMEIEEEFETEEYSVDPTMTELFTENLETEDNNTQVIEENFDHDFEEVEEMTRDMGLDNFSIADVSFDEVDETLTNTEEVLTSIENTIEDTLTSNPSIINQVDPTQLTFDINTEDLEISSLDGTILTDKYGVELDDLTSELDPDVTYLNEIDTEEEVRTVDAFAFLDKMEDKYLDVLDETTKEEK
ncbi:hypothetical protein [Mesoplasma photuris]|uniref:hypothetical protein n=1 Tax=Mesoplasma photuris TaxID=217731 RepID=UPI0004E21181|nr:hypothetical protein [Mesoplasma photuris]